MKKLSVIVPMYNVSDYIEDCLESLAAQTFSDMEIILVDDGCTDDTPLKAERFARERPDLFRVLHKQNGGLSDARNYGMEHSSSEYIAFLDSDDFVSPDLYEAMMAEAEKGYGIVVCDIEYWYEEAERRFLMKGLYEGNCDSLQARALLSPMFAWNKVYRRELFSRNRLNYPLNTWYEDIPVTTLLFATCDRIGHTSSGLVHYRQRSGSIMANVTSPRVKEIFPVLELVRHEFNESGLYETFYSELEYLHIENLCLYGMFRFIRSGQWKSLYQQSREVMKTYFPDWRKNKYIRQLGIKNRVFLQFYNQATAFIFHRLIRS